MVRFLSGGCVLIDAFGLNTNIPPGAVAADELGLFPFGVGKK